MKLIRSTSPEMEYIMLISITSSHQPFFSWYRSTSGEVERREDKPQRGDIIIEDIIFNNNKTPKG